MQASVSCCACVYRAACARVTWRVRACLASCLCHVAMILTIECCVPCLVPYQRPHLVILLLIFLGPGMPASDLALRIMAVMRAPAALLHRLCARTLGPSVPPKYAGDDVVEVEVGGLAAPHGAPAAWAWCAVFECHDLAGAFLLVCPAEAALGGGTRVRTRHARTNLPQVSSCTGRSWLSGGTAAMRLGR